MTTKPQTINVGNFGTSPVDAYVKRTGTINAAATIERIIEIVPKKAKGR